MYSKILKKIMEYQTIIIHRHAKPDGDALGSQLGLKDAISRTFKDKEVYAVGDMTSRYSFMGEMDEVDDIKYQNALVFVVDCPEEQMISDTRYKNAKYVIKLDHHLLKAKYGDFEIIKTDYESCCRLVSEIIFSLKLDLSNEGAKALYTGMVTDSGRFRYDSTTTNTFKVAAKLLTFDFNLSDVYNELYTDELDMCILRAKYTLKMKLAKGNVAYIMTTYQELLETKADIFAVSRGMVNTMSGIRGIDIWANFTEDANGKVYAEVRSNKYNINEIAVKYGGGGHRCASGATLNSFDEAYQMIADLEGVKENDEANN